MLKLFFYWLFHKSKTLQRINDNYVKSKMRTNEIALQTALLRIFDALEVNQNKYC